MVYYSGGRRGNDIMVIAVVTAELIMISVVVALVLTMAAVMTTLTALE